MEYFSNTIIDKVWEKATIVDGFDSNNWRKDFAGAWICKSRYGTLGKYGWLVTFLKPESIGGKNELDNLIPMHWLNKNEKADDYPSFFTKITSENEHNKIEHQAWVIK